MSVAHEQHLTGRSEEGTVVLDIGGDVGALIVFVPEALMGSEIEIRERAGEWNGTHTGVRERLMGNSVLCAGVFGSLKHGLYEIRMRGGREKVVQSVEVVGGRVNEFVWAPQVTI